MNVDRQRVAAVRTLQALGYLYWDGEWVPPATATTPLSLLAEADAQHAALMRRADALAGRTEVAPTREGELEAIVDAIEAYEARRWPLGKDPAVPHGKG
jgi:hypothetical protein